MSYARINNSFDGVQTLPIPEDGSITSCSCQNCKYPKSPGDRCCFMNTKYGYDSGIKTLPECNDPMSCQRANFACYDNVIFNRSVQPDLYEHPFDLRILNNNNGLRPVPGFYKVDKTACDNAGYTIDNYGKIIDAPRSIQLKTDAIPMTGEININQLSKIYDKQYEGYGKNYKNYRDINTGQITYYYDKSIADPYFQPLYTIQSDTEAYILKDPMDSLKPYYSKRPLNHTLHNISGDQMTRDTLSFREDLMSLQSGLMNRSSWSARFASPAYSNSMYPKGVN